MSWLNSLAPVLLYTLAAFACARSSDSSGTKLASIPSMVFLLSMRRSVVLKIPVAAQQLCRRARIPTQV
eukprot:1224188-Prymnesium_polylepis.1